MSRPSLTVKSEVRMSRVLSGASHVVVPWHTGSAARQVLESSEIPHQRAALGIGVSYQTLYKWLERDEWTDRQLERFAAFAGVSLEWLRTGKGEPYDEHWLSRQLAMERQRLVDTLQRVCVDYESRVRDLYTTDPTTREKRRRHDTHPQKRLR
ncbi:MAG: helix-turn-helix domain-containing protein [Pseudomonadota bacterium]|jgi:hypothetical protein